MIKKRVAFDINSTIDNFVEVLLEMYNEKYNDNLLYENIIDYDLRKFIKKECKDMFGEFINEDMYKRLKILDGAKCVINYCYEHFDVRFVSAAFPSDVPIFYNLLKENFQWMETKHFCRIEDKQFYNVDLLCDDYQENLIGAQYNKLIITRPWNKDFDNKNFNIHRINNLDENSIGVINNILCCYPSSNMPARKRGLRALLPLINS